MQLNLLEADSHFLDFRSLLALRVMPAKGDDYAVGVDVCRSELREWNSHLHLRWYSTRLPGREEFDLGIRLAGRRSRLPAGLERCVIELHEQARADDERVEGKIRRVADGILGSPRRVLGQIDNELVVGVGNGGEAYVAADPTCKEHELNRRHMAVVLVKLDSLPAGCGDGFARVQLAAVASLLVRMSAIVDPSAGQPDVLTSHRPRPVAIE